MKRLLRVLRKPPRVWWMVMQAYVLSAWYRWCILHRPFEELSPRIGTLQYETPYDEICNPEIQEVKFAVVGVCNHTPWESKCLVQALTAKKLLNRKKLPCTLYMGVARNEKGELVAHAWLRCGVKLVTGGRNAGRFTVTTRYGDKE